MRTEKKYEEFLPQTVFKVYTWARMYQEALKATEKQRITSQTMYVQT
jgi:hypothetical protein